MKPTELEIGQKFSMPFPDDSGVEDKRIFMVVNKCIGCKTPDAHLLVQPDNEPIVEVRIIPWVRIILVE